MLIMPAKYSFRLLSKKNFKPKARKNSSRLSNVEDLSANSSESADKGKRDFLKLAGVAGIGLIASQVLPKSASAYVMGGAPTSNVVGVKDSTDARIDPATEATLALIQAKTANLTFDGSNNLLTSSSGGGAVTVKDTTNTQINPATDDSVILLRRILKQVDSLGVVDSAQRQKMTLDSITSGLTLSTVTAVGTVSTVTTVGTVTSATNLVALGGVDGRYLYIDTARNMYANGIRTQLSFS